jgi:hypothetical protein
MNLLNNKINIFLKIFILPILIISSLQQCKEKTSSGNNPMHGTMTFLRGDVLVNETKARIGTAVIESDTVEVKENAAAVIQFSNNAQITVESNTKISIKTLVASEGGKPKIDIDQKSGSTFNKIIPGQAEYSLRSPTITAGVRGTSFMMKLDEKGKTNVQLLRGKVGVSNPNAKTNEASEETIIEAGHKIQADEKGEITAAENLSVEEEEKLSKFNEIAFLPVAKLEKIESAKSEDLESIMESMPEVMPIQIEQIIMPEAMSDDKEMAEPDKELTLSDLKKKYGALSKISTKDGETYVGAFRQVGGNMEITTTTGTKIIEASQIESVEQYK